MDICTPSILLYLYISFRPTIEGVIVTVIVCHGSKFTTTYAISTYNTNVVNSNPAHGEVYSMQYCGIKFVSYLRQVSGFIKILRFPSEFN